MLEFLKNIVLMSYQADESGDAADGDCQFSKEFSQRKRLY